MRTHPEAFEEAKAYEKTALEHGSPFTWSDRESLSELEQPDRVQQIEEDYRARLERAKKRRLQNPLRANLDEVEIDEAYGLAEISSSCLICHK